MRVGWDFAFRFGLMIRNLTLILVLISFLPKNSLAACGPDLKKVDGSTGFAEITTPVTNMANAGRIESLREVPIIQSTALKLNIPSEGVAYQATSDSRGTVATQDTTSSISIAFKDVDAAHFESLKDTFSGWSKTANRVTFEALLNKNDGEPARIMTSDGKGTSTITNCWSTAYEIVKQAEEDNPFYNLFFIPAADALSVLTNRDQSKIVGGMSFSHLLKMSPEERAKSFQIGDTIVIYMDKTKTMPFHEATWLGGDVVFEKPDYSPNNPFRLDTLSSLAAEYGSSTFVEFHRWINGSPLPPILSQTFPSTPWINDANAGYYLQLQNHTLDPWITGQQRVEFFKLVYDDKGLASLVSVTSDRP